MKRATMEISPKEMEVRPNTISDLKVDASFRKIAKNAICFHIWRIDEDRLEAVAKAQYGTFHDDAAYIIYAASVLDAHVNQDTITRETKAGTNLERYIHFWLGEKVSEQKRSNVAHKLRELDSYFGNVATEYRETQDNETARFLSYFKRGIIIRSGNLATTNSTPNRLFQLRGRKWLRCIEMEAIAWSHFASNYIMVLQIDAHLFLWIGRSSSAIERRDAIELATTRWPLANASNSSNTATLTSQPTITIVDDGYEQSMAEASKTIWNAYLPLNQRVVSQTAPSMPDRQHTGKLKIYKCAYRTNRLHLDQMDVVMPTRDDLSDSTTVFVLDAHGEAVWLWVGKETKQSESISAMGNGRAFVKKKKYPYCTPVVRVVEGHEPVEFTRLFPNWYSDWHNEHSNISLKPASANLGRFDSMTLCQRPKMAASTQLIDDGSGERIIYRITKDQVIEIPANKIIMFCTQHAYVVRYLVVIPSANTMDAQSTGIKSIIYQWNGSEASADVVTKCERFAKTTFEEDQQLQQSMFVQMSEFDETPHFLQLFEGKLIILQNDRHLQYVNNHNGHTHASNQQGSTEQHFVLKICGDATYNSKAVEVYPVSVMSSKECYVVRTNHVWVWCGQSSTGDAREVAKNVGALLGESSLVLEGKEPKDFWRSVANQINQPQTSQQPLLTANGSVCSSNSSSGHGSASSNGNSPSSIGIGGYLGNQVHGKNRPQAQLFLVWAQRGSFCCAEIMAYEQRDLAPECVYILDAGLITYIWLGAYACSYEKEKYLKMVQHYLDTAVPLARRPTTAVAVVRQNSEPNVFKGFFEQWNYDLWKNFMNYEQRRQVLMTQPLTNGTNGEAHTNGSTTNGTALPVALLNNHKDFDRHHKYPISTLQQETDLLPVEVNPLKREVHLTHDDFVSVFSMSFWEFDELPGWKKQELKKKYKLF